MNKYKYLSKINLPADLKQLPREAMEPLSEEVRDFLIDNVSRTGGHLASNLGVVELSIALHRLFETPHDHIIWDVGHQSYVHKILTGRKNDFGKLRASGGISGFPKIEESEHDAFGTGHSSTSISAALGFAESDRIKGSDAYTVAIVGDGAYTGGMIHEGLNNCRKDLRLIIILNENEMSISKNIGRFAASLSKLRISSNYFKAKKFTGNVIKHIPLIGKPLFGLMLKVKKAFKNIMYGSNYFEDLGLYYIGPIDGNNYESVEKALSEAKKLNESVVIHLKTVKGKGYQPAEENPGKYHGVAPIIADRPVKTFTDCFGEHICELAANDEKICAITAAMCDGTGLDRFKNEFSERFFDVGIAEEHAVTFGAGLAANGMRPVVAIYSTFLQRAYDNVIHDVALQNLPVTFCIDRAGLNEKDGATHHGIFDVAFLSQIPNMTIYTPITEMGLKASLEKAIYSGGPVAIRYANASENDRIVKEFYSGNVDFDTISVKRNYSNGDAVDSVIITYGKITSDALIACDALEKQGIKASVILLEKLKPYDVLAKEISKILPIGLQAIVYLEEGIKNGGAGMLLRDELERICDLKEVKSEILAINDDFVSKSDGKTAYEAAKISAVDIEKIIEKLLK